MPSLPPPLTSACLAAALLLGPACRANGGADPVVHELRPHELGTLERVHGSGDLLLASQPGPADLEELARAGYRTVINQRRAEELTAFDERAVVTGLGMTYHNPGWRGPAELTDAILDDTRALLRTAERPLLIHCSSANRTGATWLAYRVLDQGFPVEEALAEAKAVGLRTPEYEAIVLDYVARRASMP